MFISRIIAGLAAGNIGVIQALIADNTAPEERARFMGLLGASIGAGFVFGPALGGLLSGLGGGPLHQAPFAIAGTFTIIAFLLCLRLPHLPVIDSDDDKEVPISATARLVQLVRGPLGLFALAFFLLNLSFSQVEAAFVLFLKDAFAYRASDTGWIFTYVGVCIIIVEGGLIGRAVKKFGEIGVIIGGASLLTAGQFITALTGAGLIFAHILPLAVVLLCTTMICVGGMGSQTQAYHQRPQRQHVVMKWVAHSDLCKVLARLVKSWVWLWQALLCCRQCPPILWNRGIHQLGHVGGDYLYRAPHYLLRSHLG